ncbi:uL15m family ribosomal protein [Halomarina ordinaria]|uniref:Large ribosomal subunit protein uL15 n=1 Tax=Halomarina ordinaria TaxID=3033939 RepID=A0ABD5U8R4_9EURY|nr:uL15m family ribosomal protein [Halomarina sp. PSRA2]
MTSKKRRQRGSRTHGGGTHKNRRGAGNRGGRGRAGRNKHEFHQYEPLGKYGFNRPEKAKETVVTVDLQKLDEDIALHVEEGVAEETDDGYAVDARDVAEDGHSADAVKVLGNGQVFNTLDVTADAFSDSAVSLIEDEGGSATLTERGEARHAEKHTPDDSGPDE